MEKDDEQAAFELELESCILNGAIDDAFVLPKIEANEHAQEEADHVGSAPIGVELAPPEHTEGHGPKTKPPMRNPSRERLKRELGFLREYATELEAELTTLRAQKRPLELASSFIKDTNSTALLASGDSPWKMAVDTERAKRIRSERENDRLRRSLETQLRVAEELSLYLRERAAATTTYEAPTHLPPTLVSTSFDLVVSHLLHDIDRAYAVTSSVFAGSSWETLPDERVFVTTVKTRQCGGADQMYIELMDTAYRSFPYERSCEAAWEATRFVYASESRVINVGPSTDDVIAVRFRTTGATRRGLPKDLLVTFVAKKFIEQDRMVLLWRTANNPAQPDSDMPMHAVSDETGWMLITRVPEGVENRPAGTAYFQACSRLVPAWFEGDVADSSVRTQLAIGEFTNVVLSATEADVTGFETAFQRLVLDDTNDSSVSTDGTAANPLDTSETLFAFV